MRSIHIHSRPLNTPQIAAYKSLIAITPAELKAIYSGNMALAWLRSDLRTGDTYSLIAIENCLTVRVQQIRYIAHSSIDNSYMLLLYSRGNLLFC